MIATVIATGEKVDIYPSKLVSAERIDDRHYIKHWIWGEFNTRRTFQESELIIPDWNVKFRYDQ